MENDTSEVEKDLQRFKSQDGAPLPSLRGRYDRELKLYYLRWNEVDAAFPDVDHILVPPSKCAFLIDKTFVDSDEIYTVIYKNLENGSSLDPDRDLIYSNESAPSPLFLPEHDSIKTTLHALCGNDDLYTVLIEARRASKTYEDLATETERLGVDERYAFMTLYVNMESRYNRTMVDIARILDVEDMSEAICLEMANTREHLTSLRRKAIAAELDSRFLRHGEDSEVTALDYPMPFASFLLPVDIENWEPNNPSSHTFRLHFICHYNPPESEDSVESSGESQEHLLQHPGYAIRDYDSFLRHHGYVALYLLQGCKCDIWKQDNNEGTNESGGGGNSTLSKLAEGSQFSAVELGVLVDMAIESLQRSVTPQMKVDFNPDFTRRLPLYLMDDSSTKDIPLPLYPTMHKRGLDWICKRHFYEKYTESALTSLCDHVRSLEGHHNMQIGTWAVKVNSIEEVRDFFKVVGVTKAIIDLTLSLLWEATEPELQEIVVGANAVHIVHLRLDGKEFKDHPMYTTEPGSVFIHNIITANERNLGSVTFSNIVNLHRAPASVEYITFITNRRIVTTGLPAMSSVEWDGFKRFVFNFHKAIGERQTNSGEENRADVISGDEPNDNNPGTVHRRNTEELRLLVEEHRYVLSLTYLTGNHLATTFDMPNGVFRGLVKARFPVDLNEQFLYTGSLQHFVLEIDSTNTNYLLILGKVLKHNPDLLEVMIGTKESILLSQVVFCCSCISGRVNPLHVSFYDECVGAQERVVAKLILSPVTQAAIEGSVNHSRCEFSFSSIDIEIVEWVMDYGFEALSDDEAAALDTITLQFPDTLIYFNLDIRDLTKAGIESIRRVLSRSSIQFLRINCGLFDVDLKPDLVHAIAHLRRSSLLSLILRGEAVITWLELLAEATTHFTSHGQTRGSLASPEYQLVQFEVINTAPDLHLLSTRAMETIFHVYCSCSLVDFSLVHVDL
ncbi:hypothetical protein MVEG_02938 [Podila verticillata NRRL 6337]|nr:hypothetical protein MVEG_02938 [Podila verticillata NRRL 6337]